MAPWRRRAAVGLETPCRRRRLRPARAAQARRVHPALPGAHPTAGWRREQGSPSSATPGGWATVATADGWAPDATSGGWAALRTPGCGSAVEIAAATRNALGLLPPPLLGRRWVAARTPGARRAGRPVKCPRLRGAVAARCCLGWWSQSSSTARPLARPAPVLLRRRAASRPWQRVHPLAGRARRHRCAWTQEARPHCAPACATRMGPASGCHPQCPWGQQYSSAAPRPCDHGPAARAARGPPSWASRRGPSQRVDSRRVAECRGVSVGWRPRVGAGGPQRGGPQRSAEGRPARDGPEGGARIRAQPRTYRARLRCRDGPVGSRPAQHPSSPQLAWATHGRHWRRSRN